MIENTQGIAALMHNALADQAAFGVSYALIGPDQNELHYLGMQGSGPDALPLTPNMQYDLASLTKVVGTTTRLLQLLAAGTIQLADPVGKYVPDLAHPQLTIEQLLLHNSGLPADIPNALTMTAEELTAKIKQAPLANAPGTKFVYSDLGFIQLGWVIQQVDGDLAASLRENVFSPLGMKQTGFNPDQSDLNVFVPTEDVPARGGVLRGVVHDEKAAVLHGISGHAGLFSSLTDLNQFVRMYLNHGYCRDQQILPTSVFDWFRQIHFQGRTLGWQCWRPGGDLLWHTGFTGTSIALDLTHQTGFVCLTNRVYPTRTNLRWLTWRRLAVSLFYNRLEDIDDEQNHN